MKPDDLRRSLQAGAAGLAGRRSLITLKELAQNRGLQVYLVGGTVRELALGRESPDLDLAVSAHTLKLASDLALALAGTYVMLDDRERTARVVAGADTLDLAEFRAPGIEGDLKGRDFTINAMALELGELLKGGTVTLLDPLGGLEDLARGLIRMVAPANLTADPLRLLRAFRFAAALGFQLTSDTLEAIRQRAGLLETVAGERLRQELFLLLAAPRAAAVVRQMDDAGLFCRLLPELCDGKGVAQDGFHHLDVFAHSLETLACLERVLATPEAFFHSPAPEIRRLAQDGWWRAVVKLAALFHDAGKPKVQGRRTDPDRYTFYYHEKVGAELFTQAGRRLRLSQEEIRTVTHLIGWHMRPFLLLPAFRRGELTLRALGRMVRALRPHLAAGLAVAMADSLAAQGPQKPLESEAALASLAEAAWRFLKERLEPQEHRPRLLTGHDLKRVFHLTPGPRFRVLLTAVEEAQWEGKVRTREEALALIARLLPKNVDT
jgi:poly(A) polymerase